MPATMSLTECLAQASARTAARRQHDADVRQRLEDLVTYTSRARTAGTAECDRLYARPGEVVACIESYVVEVLGVLAEWARGDAPDLTAF